MQITVTQAAESLGVSRRWVQLRCEELGIGRMVTPRMRLLSAADVRKLRKIPLKPPGRKPSRETA